jgi:hypothetical protein
MAGAGAAQDGDGLLLAVAEPVPARIVQHALEREAGDGEVLGVGVSTWTKAERSMMIWARRHVDDVVP